MTRHALAAASGLVADRWLGEPPAAAHPLRWFGAGMDAVERRVWRDTKLAGVVHASVGLTTATGAAALARSAGAATWLAVGGRALWSAAAEVEAALNEDDVGAARALLPALVGRDPIGLDEKEIARAAVESVAENTVDAIVAPALWAAVGGAAGAFGYRAVNTLDAMVGHRSPRYARFGWASARLDDVAGWVPARVTAALVVAVRPGSSRAVWSAVRRQAPSHPSPNAGVAEAAFAAALGIRLGGTNVYQGRVEVRPALGDGPPPGTADIGRAVRLSSDVTWALTAGLAAVAVTGLSGRRRRGSGRG